MAIASATWIGLCPQGDPTVTRSASSAFIISALTRDEKTMPGSGTMPSATTISAPSPALLQIATTCSISV